MVADLARMPHLLIAGTTGSGKSVGINAMVLSLLYKSTAEHVRLIMIDPKMLELSVYEGIPHLLAPVVTDMKQAANALRWCVAEMERRYQLMAALGVRNIAGFNRRVQGRERRRQADPRSGDDAACRQRSVDRSVRRSRTSTPLPYIVVVIDELADLMMIVGKKVEELIARLAQKARASGIHLILATQRPSVDVITGLIKANIPCRIAFQVSANVDSRTILDQMGAETLLGHGDMLYLPPGTSMPTRVHGAFVSDQEVHRVVDALKTSDAAELHRGGAVGTAGRRSRDCRVRRTKAVGAGEDAESDPLYDEAVSIVTQRAQALDFLRAAAPEDRLQPRRAPARGDGAGGTRRSAAVERRARSAGAGAAGGLNLCARRQRGAAVWCACGPGRCGLALLGVAACAQARARDAARCLS